MFNEDKLRERLQRLRLSRLLPKLLADCDLWHCTVAKAVKAVDGDDVVKALLHPAAQMFLQQLETALLPSSRSYEAFAVQMFATSEVEKPAVAVATTISYMLQLFRRGYWPDGDLLRFFITTKIFVRNKHLQIRAQAAALKAEGLSKHKHIMQLIPTRPSSGIVVGGEFHSLPLESISRSRLVTICLGVVRPFSTQLLIPLELKNDDEHFYIVQAAVRAIDATMEEEMGTKTQIACLMAAAAVIYDLYVYAVLACEMLDS